MEFFIISLGPNNKLQSLQQGPTGWFAQTTPTLDDAVGNSFDIAMNHNRRFYGVSEGRMHEYEMSDTPEKWKYIGVVNTTATAT